MKDADEYRGVWLGLTAYALAFTLSVATQTQGADRAAARQHRSRTLTTTTQTDRNTGSRGAVSDVAMPIAGTVRDSIVSPDYQRYACVVEDNGAFHVVLDGHAHGPYDQIMRLLSNPYYYWTFNQDSEHFAICVAVGGKDYLVVDGKRSSACDEIDARNLHYSPQNESFACEARQGQIWGWLVHNGLTSRFLTAQPGDDPGAASAPRVEAFMYGTGFQSLYNPTTELFGRPGLQVYHRKLLRLDPFFFVTSQNRLCLSQDHQHVFYRMDPPTFMAAFKASVPCPALVIDGRREGHQ